MISGQAATFYAMRALEMSPPAEETRPDKSASLPLLELTSRIAQGDEAAFDLFYRDYSRRLFRFLLVLTAGNELASGDLLQSVLLKAARKMKRFDSEGQLWAWLSQIARNEWHDSLRRGSRQERLTAALSSASEHAAGTEETPFLHWLEAELGRLDENERQLVIDFYFEKEPQSSIAQRTGRTVKSIECELARIRKKLKEAMLRRLKHES